jgi:hypothetical protein
MPAAEADIRASLDAVIDDVETSQRIFGWVSGVVGDLAREARNLTRTVEDRFDRVESRFDAIEEHNNRFERRLDLRLDLLAERVGTDGVRPEQPEADNVAS